MRSRVQLAVCGGPPVRTRPFPRWPWHNRLERDALAAVLREPKWGIDSPRVTAFEAELAAFQQARHAISCANGTVAIEIALRALGIGPGDEVIVPSYTFVATATTVLATGATPVFADIDPATYNIDPADVEGRVTDRTRAIMPVHFAGTPADMTRLAAIARARGLFVVEDAAQAVCAEWEGRRVGALGQFGTFSFQSSKNMTAGEGGAVLTNDEALWRRAVAFQNCGRIPGGAWYRHYEPGSNHRLSAFQAALLSVQLTRVERQTARREANAAYLNEMLASLAGIAPLRQAAGVTRNALHLFIMRYAPEAWGGVAKERFVQALRAEGVPASVGYLLPLHHQDLFEQPHVRWRPGRRPDEGWRQVDYRSTSNPHSERACRDEAVWLPHQALLANRGDMEQIVEAIVKLREGIDELRQA